MYYDLDGNKITEQQWSDLRKQQNDGASRACTIAGESVEHYYVSTVWIGVASEFDDNNKPKIYETAVFDHNGEYENTQFYHYATKEEALIGHRQIVKELARKVH